MQQDQKHIMPYLPYGLKGILLSDCHEDFEELIHDLSIDKDKFSKNAVWQFAGYADPDLCIPLGSGEINGFIMRNGMTYASFDFNVIKPILQPLSDLTKDNKFTELINEELICGAWKFEHDDWTTSIKTSNNKSMLLVIQNEVAPECTVFFYNYMIENHYDVFGLIEKGRAIDINTLK